MSEMTMSEEFKLYDDFLKQIEDQSATVKQYLQERGFGFYPLNESINWIVKKWEMGRKICRPLRIFPLFEMFAGRELPKQLKLCLISLDAKINFLDDFIDSRNLNKEKKGGYGGS